MCSSRTMMQRMKADITGRIHETYKKEMGLGWKVQTQCSHGDANWHEQTNAKYGFQTLLGRIAYSAQQSPEGNGFVIAEDPSGCVVLTKPNEEYYEVKQND